MSKEKMSEVLSLENRALLERLSEFERALTRNSVNSLQEIVRSFEEHLLLLRRWEEEALFPAMARHLPGHGEPVTRRRLKGREHGERLKELRSNIQKGHRGKFLYQGHLFVTILRDHLLGAHSVLLPLAERLLSPGEWDRVRKGFESISFTGKGVAAEAVVLVQLPVTNLSPCVAAS
jgi:hemerythrin-like domain-containing protein